VQVLLDIHSNKITENTKRRDTSHTGRDTQQKLSAGVALNIEKLQKYGKRSAGIAATGPISIIIKDRATNNTISNTGKEKEIRNKKHLLDQQCSLAHNKFPVDETRN